MKFRCIIVSKFSDVPAEHKSAVKSWFFFHFFMLALCVINILFFICNWADLRLQINDTTNILLTIIGFLFAFAGINIYSIFNTNFESEKAKMIELQNKYSMQMELTIHKMKFYDSIHQLQLYSQLIFNLTKTNSQIFEWVDKVKMLCTVIQKFVEDSKKRDTVDTFESDKDNLVALYRGLKYQQKSFLNKIVNSQSVFFQGMDSKNQKALVENISTMLNAIDFLDEDDNLEDYGLVEQGNCNRISSFLKKCRNTVMIFFKRKIKLCSLRGRKITKR